MANSENKHLRKRGDVWFFQRRVPKAAQAVYGVVSLNRSLGTTDVELARVRRDELNAYLQNQKDLEPLFLAWQEVDTSHCETELQHAEPDGAVLEDELLQEFGGEEEACEEYDLRVERLMAKILHLSSSLETVETSLTRFSVDLNNVELAYHNLARRVAQIPEINPEKLRKVS